MPTLRTQFPYAIREIEHTWIPLKDGTRLAARLWLPQDAERRPAPAILEYIPYRKNEHTAHLDSLMHPYFAGHGYASVRVDIRGNGESDGILLDEYLKQEQEDALEVLVWLAAQPWCTGAVGMIGYSWGGFAGLQVAARRPPQLKAIITHCSTDDRYHDDCHYMGGCLLASDMLKWASYMFAYTAQPPDPRWVGERWRVMWLERMAQSPPFVEAWLTHQRRDAFWKHGSVCETYRRPGGASLPEIECAVYATGGWADSYTNAIPRLLAGLTCPRKGLIGPWAHRYPELGVPGPSIGYLQECLRWWDYWLKGEDNGIMAEPMLRVWMQDAPKPGTHYADWPGHWIAEPVWPSANLTEQTLWLQPQLLATQPPAESALTAPYQLTVGQTAGVWCAYGAPGDMPDDQRADDALSLCFDSAPATEPTQYLGFPEITLTLAVDKPLAQIAARLCDVAPHSGERETRSVSPAQAPLAPAPGGESLLVSWGLLNLTHRDSHEHPIPLQPGTRYTVTLKLNAIGHCLAAGHRWRLALSPSYWPHAWPAPEPVTLTVFTGAQSKLTLPVRAPRAEDSALPDFLPAETAPPLAVEVIQDGKRERTLRRDLVAQPARLELWDTFSPEVTRFITADGLEYGNASCDIYTISDGDPLSAAMRCERTITFARGAWRIRIETESVMTADARQFHVTNILKAYQGEQPVFDQTRVFSVPRDLG